MGRILILLDDRGHMHSVNIDGSMATVRGLGTIETRNLQNRVGRRLDVGERRFLVLAPSGRDLRATMERGAQTLVPKDLAAILYDGDIVPGSRVVEAGCGSGALTVALARLVRPSGRVVAYDVRRECIAIARANLDRAALSDFVEFRQGDVRRGVPDRQVDAFMLDLPDPGAAVPAAWEALRACGHLATFSPNMEQVKETVAAIRLHPFVDIRTIELIEREMEVRDVGMRPSFAPLGHTGYLTFARKVLETF